MNAEQTMAAVDDLVSHVWMVRAFLKHSDEAAEDDELASVHRDLYDFMLALGPSSDAGDADEYLKMAKKKLTKLKQAVELFLEIQPEISTHTNFKMAARSLKLATANIVSLVSGYRRTAATNSNPSVESDNASDLAKD